MLIRAHMDPAIAPEIRDAIFEIIPWANHFPIHKFEVFLFKKIKKN